MATSEQKKELVEELKGPHYYRVTVNGYGAEASYIKLNKEAFEFWKESLENGDSDCVHYVTSAEDKTPAEVNADTEYAPAKEGHWLIFPGKTWHRPGILDSKEWRYIVAADMEI